MYKYQDLEDAIYDDDVELFKRIEQDGYRDMHGVKVDMGYYLCSILIEVIRNNSEEIFNFMIKTFGLKRCKSALLEAFRYCKVNKIKVLMDKGIDLSEYDSKAIKMNKDRIVDILYDMVDGKCWKSIDLFAKSGIDFDSCSNATIDEAISLKDKDVYNKLQEYRVQMGLPMYLDLPESSVSEPEPEEFKEESQSMSARGGELDRDLVQAVVSNNLIDVIEALAHGANIHYQNDLALQLAARNNNRYIFSYLLQNGADKSVLGEVSSEIKQIIDMPHIAARYIEMIKTAISKRNLMILK